MMWWQTDRLLAANTITQNHINWSQYDRVLFQQRMKRLNNTLAKLVTSRFSAVDLTESAARRLS